MNEYISPLEIFQEEVLSYKSMQRIKSTDDPIAWWKKYSLNFIHLSHLASKYLCSQASSVASESMFSLAGDIVSYKRARIDPANVNRIISLKKNAVRLT